jgi:phage anti-repressor protein
MIGNLNTWKISLNNENIKNILLNSFEIKNHLTYLLDTNKTEYSVIEKFVHEIAMFHFNRLNIPFDKNKYIEFWIKNESSTQSNRYHFDCDEYDKCMNKPDKLITPLLSCIVYMDNSTVPTLITNVDQESYNTMNVKENATLILSFPKYLKHITFDGGNNCHGILNFFEKEEQRYVLAINLWDVRPSFVPYFDYITFINMIFVTKKKRMEDMIINIDKNTKLIDICLDMKNRKTINLENMDIINPEFFKNIFFNKKKNNNEILKLYEIIKDNLINFDTFYFDLPNNTLVDSPQQTTKEITAFDMSLSKFKQRIIIPNIYSSIICDWIVKEYEKHNTEEYSIKIDNLKSIFLFSVESFSIILENITKYYCLNENKINYNIIDAIIVRNTPKKINIGIEKDYNMKVSILLNDDFEGGGICFEDEITSFLEKGSMIIHNSKVKNTITEITKGSQYMLQIYIQFIKIN